MKDEPESLKSEEYLLFELLSFPCVSLVFPPPLLFSSFFDANKVYSKMITKKTLTKNITRNIPKDVKGVTATNHTLTNLMTNTKKNFLRRMTYTTPGT